MSTALKQLKSLEPTDVVFIDVGDWKVIYINGEKILEGHSIQEIDIFQALGITFQTRWIEDSFSQSVSANWPQKLKSFEDDYANFLSGNGE